MNVPPSDGPRGAFRAGGPGPGAAPLGAGSAEAPLGPGALQGGSLRALLSFGPRLLPAGKTSAGCRGCGPKFTQQHPARHRAPASLLQTALRSCFTWLHSASLWLHSGSTRLHSAPLGPRPGCWAPPGTCAGGGRVQSTCTGENTCVAILV